MATFPLFGGRHHDPIFSSSLRPFFLPFSPSLLPPAWQKWQLPSGMKTEEESISEDRLPRGKKLPPVFEEDEEGEEHQHQQPPSLSQPLSPETISNRPRSHTIGSTPLFHQDTSLDLETYDHRRKLGRRAHQFRNVVVRITWRGVSYLNWYSAWSVALFLTLESCSKACDGKTSGTTW